MMEEDSVMEVAPLQPACPFGAAQTSFLGHHFSISTSAERSLAVHYEQNRQSDCALSGGPASGGNTSLPPEPHFHLEGGEHNAPHTEGLPGRPSPPPGGTCFDCDCDLERAPTMPSYSFHEDEPVGAERDMKHMDKERRHRQEIQLIHWKSLLIAKPNEELAFFWREQVDALEKLLQRHERAGVKRERSPTLPYQCSLVHAERALSHHKRARPGL